MAQPPTILDLTDEEGLLFDEFVEYEPQGVRALLAALNLQISGQGETHTGEVFDLAIYRATGDRHLATLFGAAR